MTRLVSIDDVPMVLLVGDQAAEEREARERWFLAAERSRMGTCEVCGSDRTTEGKPLPVVRVHGGRLFKCFTCTTNPPKRRRSMPATTTKKPAAAKPEAVPTRSTPAAQRFEMLPLAKLKPAPDNPRKDVGDITEMAETMKTLGVLEPFVTVQQNGHFLIVAGHRRYAAAAAAGLLEVPVIIRELTEEQRVEAMLIENLQRTDLTPIEEGEAFKRLIEEFGLNQRDLAVKVGRSQGHISKRIQLLDLPDVVLKALDSGGITLADAAALLVLKATPKRLLEAYAEGVQYGNMPRWIADQVGEQELEDKTTAAIAELKAKGIKYIPANTDSYYGLPKGSVALDSYDFRDITKMSPATHAKQPCHAATVNNRGEIRLICTNRSSHAGKPTVTDPADEKAARAKEREAEKAKMLRAREKNIELGATLETKLAAPTITADQMRLLADLLVMHDGAGIAQGGLRYTDGDSQTVVTKKDGTVSRIVHVDHNRAGELLTDRLKEAKSAEEIMGVLLQALIAARYADENAVSNSQQWGGAQGISRVGWRGTDGPIRTLVERIAQQTGVIPKTAKAAA